MKEISYPSLFTPITLGKTMFKNRIFASPTGCLDVSTGGVPTLHGSAYYERKAEGGAAAVTIGDCIVDTKTGQITAYQVNFEDPFGRPRFAKLADAISRHGAIASVELQHGGMFSHYVYEEGRPLYGPVDMEIPDERKVNDDGHQVNINSDGFRKIHALTEEQIFSFIDSFGRSAAYAKMCGFGMVTIHAGHGWGLAQFLSPTLNTRTDQWGGSFENRIRLTLEVVKCVRVKVGHDFPIEIRISGAECTDTGYEIDEGIRIAKELDGKVDLIHVSAGHHESVYATMITHPNLFLPEGVNVKYAEEVKKHVSTPVATVGALTDPNFMEEIIASGKADVVEVARSLLADPDWPRKARAGLDRDINRCMRCCACLSNSTLRRMRACATNPEIGRELDVKMISPPKVLKKVLVIGGGIAGMEASIRAAKRGHAVVLCEKSKELGGTLNCERKVPFKDRLAQYLERQEHRVYSFGVDVRLQSDAQSLIKEIVPDVIIAALGATAIRPLIDGIDKDNVFSAEEVYFNPKLAEQNVLIIGGGLVGIELGIYLSGLNHKVIIVEKESTLNDGGNVAHMHALNTQIEMLAIDVRLNTSVEKINSDGVIAVQNANPVAIKADTVVYAVGQKALNDEVEKFRFLANEFYQVGDCLIPRNIMEATKEAYFTACDI